MIEPEVSITQSQLDERDKNMFKSFLLRLIHCSDNALYEEEIVVCFGSLIRDLKREYKEKYGEDVE